MGITEDKKKFKPTKEQTNPTGNTDQKTNRFDVDKETIKKQQNKQ